MPDHLGSLYRQYHHAVNMTVGQDVRVQGVVWQPGATLGATGANNLPGIRTNMNSGRGRARGHGLI